MSKIKPPFSIVCRADMQGPRIGKPYFRHKDCEAAMKEALRLSIKHDATFMVMTVLFVIGPASLCEASALQEGIELVALHDPQGNQLDIPGGGHPAV